MHKLRKVSNPASLHPVHVVLMSNHLALPMGLTSSPSACRVLKPALEKYTQEVLLETFVSCADPFQGFRCKERK